MIINILVKDYGYNGLAIHGVAESAREAEIWRDADSANDFVTAVTGDSLEQDLIPSKRRK